MDEPTGSMDNAAESRLRERLSRIIGEKTLLLVTHRNSMLALVDRVMVVDGGKIVADGPKAKVLQALSERVSVMAHKPILKARDRALRER